MIAVAAMGRSAKGAFGRWLSLPAGKKRWQPHVFLNIVSAVVIAWVLIFEWVGGHWHFGFEPQSVQCLPYEYYLLAQDVPDAIERGEIYRYTARGLTPVVPDGTKMVKIAAAVEGDKVDVNADGVFINGVRWGGLTKLTMEKTGKTLAEITTSYIVPTGKVLMLGTLPRSYDGRYWGLIDAAQIDGEAFPVW